MKVFIIFSKVLDRVIERAKNIFVDEDERKNKRRETEEESSIYCVTCGHEIHTGSALKHMEKCFNKVGFLNLLF